MATRWMAYVGSRTTRERNARGDGISVFAVDAGTGQLTLEQVVGDLVNPSYQVLNQRGDRLYTVHGDQTEVSVLAVDAATGHLTRLQTISCGGRNPVHLALSPGETHLVVSNHLSGQLAVLPVLPDGTLAPVSRTVAFPGEPGPHRKEQPFSKPHFNPFTPDGRFVLVPDKGLDRVFSVDWNGGLPALAKPQSWYTTRENAGPRHLALHPHQPWVYVVNELDNTVTACHVDTTTGALHPFQIVPCLPDDYVGHSRAAGIQMAPTGRHVYASNRGHDSIATFRIDANTGRIALQGTTASQGKTPRFFTLAPLAPWMYVLNEDSDAIECWQVDRDSGLPQPTGRAVSCGSPVCMVFLPLSPTEYGEGRSGS
ncbi:lactonase family protein [Acidovorax sp. JHL-9]|uniref:lactonase family protein n=1 Tax=Acidovorax sp. JHL-9 TaxID=1276756 RepID=UPI0006846811|nr:lactonase family protein [Acidovorax sp. JHL-9]